MTEEGREQRVTDALKAWAQKPEPRPTLDLHWRGKTETFQVIDIEIDVVLLNSRSHRLRAQLESDPGASVVKDDPWSDSAQAVVQNLLRKTHKEYARLKASLDDEGQRDPGVITRKGVLLNANTRTAALRDLNDPNKRWIRVAVLPPDASPEELATLELGLQVQEELRDPYSLSNELLFIDDLSREYGMTNENIALQLRWAQNDPKSKRAGANDVAQRLRILALIQEMRRLADPPIALTFFDDKLEQLKALETKYNKTVSDEPDVAHDFRDNWLAASLGGASSVHDLRSVDETFVENFVVPRLGEQALLGSILTPLLAPGEIEPLADLPGLGELDPADSEPAGQDVRIVDVRKLINILASDEPTVLVPGTGKKVDVKAIKDALAVATKGAIADEKATTKTENKLEEPTANLRKAASLLRDGLSAYNTVRKDQGFQSKRGGFEYQLNQVKKLIKQIEDAVGKD